MTFVSIAPIYCEPPLSEITARPVIRRKASIRDVAHEIVHINAKIDELMLIRNSTKNPREINRILKDIDVLKTIRDLKIRELNMLRQ